MTWDHSQATGIEAADRSAVAAEGRSNRAKNGRQETNSVVVAHCRAVLLKLDTTDLGIYPMRGPWAEDSLR